MQFKNGFFASIAFSAFTLGGAALRAQTLSTSDTAIEISASQRGVIIESLKMTDPEKAQGITSVPVTLPFIAWAKLGGQRKALHWRFVGKSFDPKKGELEAVFASDEPAMELRSRWVAMAGEGGPIEHFLTIVNRGKEAIELPWGPSLVLGAKGKNLEQWWVEKGGGSPSPIGRHVENLKPRFSSNLLSTSYSNDKPHDAIPWMAVQSRDRSGGWYAGIESSARVVIHLDAVRELDAGGDVEFHRDARLAAGGGCADETRAWRDI